MASRLTLLGVLDQGRSRARSAVRTIEVNSQAIKFILEYREAFNAYAIFHHADELIDIGAPGPFFSLPSQRAAQVW